MRIDSRILDNLAEWMEKREDIPNGWIMVNLYPPRATDPKNLPQKEDKKLLEKNIKVLKAVVKAYRIDAVWAAWGNTIDTRFYLGDTRMLFCKI